MRAPCLASSSPRPSKGECKSDRRRPGAQGQLGPDSISPPLSLSALFRARNDIATGLVYAPRLEGDLSRRSPQCHILAYALCACGYTCVSP